MVQATAALKGRRILVVEDDYLIAQVLVEVLEEAGAHVVGPIGWADEAVAFLEGNTEKLDAAVLDVNLHGTKSYPVADVLVSRSVDFVFTTGYGASAIESRYSHHPRCEKPFAEDTIISVLAECGRKGH